MGWTNANLPPGAAGSCFGRLGNGERVAVDVGAGTRNLNLRCEPASCSTLPYIPSSLAVCVTRLNDARSEERRVGKECRCPWSLYDSKREHTNHGNSRRNVR